MAIKGREGAAMGLILIPILSLAAAFVIATTSGAFAIVTAEVQTRQSEAQADETRASLSELWIEPEPGRDLLYGVGGKALAPSPRSRFEVIETKKGGFSEGYTVKDEDGREWSAKLYPEGRTEVVASRILWGLGYHQPPIYALEGWTAEGARGENPQPVARFREKQPMFHGLTEDDGWSYSENPFLGTKPLAGLIVLQVLLTNADLKPGNNMRYTLDTPVENARRWWVARDLGQTFGRSGLMSALRDDIDAFDRSRFITGVEGGVVQFEYYGTHVNLLKTITKEDVRWICLRLAKLTDEQWLDAFRAGGYADLTAARFIRRIKIKMNEGLALGE
jgi:hypothetical protein